MTKPYFVVTLDRLALDEQQRVASFIEKHEMTSPPTYRLLDLVSEVGEVAKDITESTAYGDSPERVHINSDEIGDVLFSLLALANAFDIDAGEALAESVAKYEQRLNNHDTAASDN